ncbi:DUF421 domain-containing protein [Saliterribacillus persicus]|uniref:Uncharacterized membrane protein YcaP (DUF421 family) n=1 Tax=Saliterribacillus persicus TaxID=930114 RepID=A0A368XF06_9BACI|nr:DUF421 domain-containing protein [Saliterribacillus persicus]RCW66435.1 uncharacterized membrane protein YcaP (DUF421 family) [Saliterribacillus persicus]
MDGHEIILLIIRTIFSYIMIVFVFRLMGKREIGELSLLDIVIFIMIAEIAVFSIDDLKRPFIHGIVPMLVLFLIQRFTAQISMKSKLFRGWFEGRPSIIISNGYINEQEMRKNRYNFDDLTQQLRENGIDAINQVQFAILEPSGKLSVIEKEEESTSNTNYFGLLYPLILDGKIQTSSLDKIGKDETWLKSELKKRGISDWKAISFCTINSDKKWSIDFDTPSS